VNVAVTGGTGFVGGHLVEALVGRGDRISALVRASADTAGLQRSGVRLVAGHLGDGSGLATLLEGAELVYHVAGAVSASTEGEFYRVNVEGTTRMIRAAQTAGVRRFLHVSSLAVTGPTVPGHPLDESAPPRPVTPYGKSKQAAEDVVKTSGLDFTIVRPPAVYGPRDRQFLRLFRLVRRGWAPLLDGGPQELSLVHGADLAQGLIAAAVSPHTVGGTYHAASPEIVTQRALVEGIARALGRPVRVVRVPPVALRAILRARGAWARLRGRATLLSPERAAELTAAAWTCRSDALERDGGWRARTGLADGLEDTARWYKQAGWL
jgi:nucleoside-diphosphate-sugar epimerase